jgi:hypothetical protein
MSGSRLAKNAAAQPRALTLGELQGLLEDIVRGRADVRRIALPRIDISCVEGIL